jgi:ABC-type polysaccharide/polyol phosphate transport system ATPase subunit
LRDQVSRGKDGAEWMWVLRDVGFTVEPGDSLALVGLNGSGKSTLLKILTGSTEPYAGRIATSGRIGALIEIRAGIHPDLTGRENIYLNGTVLGLSRREVHSRLDEIVAFAELDDAVDRQVKFYSSGMGMRLGFSVAAFLEPSILMVDEALAVGDVAFQQRCLDRMRYVQDQGTTLLFVSHDMSAVEAMCRRSIWLDGGIVQADGLTGDVLSSYRIGLEEKARELSESSTDPVRVLAAVVEGGPDESGPRTNGEMTIRLTMRSDETREVQLSLGLSEGPAAPIFVVSRRVEVPAGQSRVACQLTDVPLPRGRYYLWAGASDTRSRSVLSWRPVAPVDIEGPARPRVPAGVMVQSPVHVETTWIGEPAPLPVLPPPPPVPPVLPDLELTQGH